jgi:hypothetical protein
VLPLIAMGAGMAFIWSPLAATATRNLPPQLAGAGSGVYNSTRQVGSVLGSAGMAAFMTSRINAEVPLLDGAPSGGEGAGAQLPDFLREPFATAMSQSLLLPAFVALFGVIAALFLLGYRPARTAAAAVAEPDEYWDDSDYVDDDDYIEFTVHHNEPAPVAARPVVRAEEDEGDTEPLAARNDHLLAAPAEPWHDEPVESWDHLSAEGRHSPLDEDVPERAAPTEVIPAVVDDPAPPIAPAASPAYPGEDRSLLDFLADVPPPKPSVEPIGFAHNGFHVDDEEHFQPLSRFEPVAEPPPRQQTRKPDVLDPEYPLDFGSHAHRESPDGDDYGPTSRHGLTEGDPEQFRSRANGRHSRAESDDASRHGRHSRPGE